MLKFLYLNENKNFKTMNLLKNSLEIHKINSYFLKNPVFKNKMLPMNLLFKAKIYMFAPQNNLFKLPLNYFTSKLHIIYHTFKLKNI